MAALKPMTPLQPLMQTNVKPPAPMLAPKQRPLKPPSPLQPKNAPKTPISHPQRRWRFQLRLSLREQRRWRFQLGASKGDAGFRREIYDARGLWRSLAGLQSDAPSHTSATRHRRCEGCRRVRRARAGFEIDHSEPQARVWRSRGRPGPTAPGTPEVPQATSSIANSGCGGRGRRRGLAAAAVGGGGDWPDYETTHQATDQRPGAAGVEGAGGSGGHGRASRSTTPSRRLACGDLAGGRARRRPEHQRGNSTAGDQAG